MKNLKRALALLLAVVMVLAMTACGQEQPAETTDPAPTDNGNTVSTQAPEVEDTGIVFPLKEEVTFDIMVKYDGDANEAAKAAPFWQELYEMTNVKINLVSLPSDSVMTNLNALFTAGKAGDAIMNNIISEGDLMSLVDSGLIIPLEDYVSDPEIMPNFHARVLSESPATKGYITAADGHIYALPRYNANNGDYLESPLWINKQWLDAVGMGVPTTIEELEAALIAFRDNDVNGNGDSSDEIPLLFMNGDSLSHMESLLGMWGLATKDGANDHYFDIDDGKAIFVPTTEAYKAAIKTIAHWWEEDLIWSEAFTGNGESFNAVLMNDDVTPLVGLVTRKNLPDAFQSQYVQITPFGADGYEPEWFLHPGRLATKSKFSVTSSCENPEILMAWIDLFYDFEIGTRISSGEENVGWKYLPDGYGVEIITYADTEQQQARTKQAIGSVFGDYPLSTMEQDYATGRTLLSGRLAIMNESYEIYKSYFDDEFWPRPYMSAESSTRLGELRTDIFNTVSLYKANWVTGVGDIDAEWDDFVKALEKMGIDEYTEIIQKEYNTFVERSK